MLQTLTSQDAQLLAYALAALALAAFTVSVITVSYTHLDVYKRQAEH